MMPRLVATGLVALLICGMLWYTAPRRSGFWKSLCIVVIGVLVVALFVMSILLLGGMIITGLWPWDPQFWEAEA